MNRPGRHCKTLRPVLIALAEGEPHPERQLLSKHLRSCPTCRRELQEIRDARDWVELAMAERDRRAAGARDRTVGRSGWRQAVAVVALLLVVGVFFFAESQRRDEGAQRLTLTHGEGAHPRQVAVAWEDSSPTFDGDEIDEGMNQLSAALFSLPSDPW